jgi:hypothetical protein
VSPAGHQVAVASVLQTKFLPGSDHLHNKSLTPSKCFPFSAFLCVLGNSDHALGPGSPRCLPTKCGGANQPCCPPNTSPIPTNATPTISSSRKLAASIVNSRHVVPFCTDPRSTCLWPADAGPGWDVKYRAAPLQDDYSISELTNTRCVIGLAHCGLKGQPCCPHAQFAGSNSPVYFRQHVCDQGLKCDQTIDLFTHPKPVLGTCKGAVVKPCGKPGQPCCSFVDLAGWSWQSCMDGVPGFYCSSKGACKACPVAKDGKVLVPADVSDKSVSSC